MEKISVRLNEALNLRNMKPIELSEKTNIDKGSISCYLSGRYDPKSKNIYLMAKALNVSPTWLLGYDVPMENDDNLSKLGYFLNNIDYNEIDEIIKNDKDNKIIAQLNSDIIKYIKISDLKLEYEYTTIYEHSIDYNINLVYNNYKNDKELDKILSNVKTQLIGGFPNAKLYKLFLSIKKYYKDDDFDKILSQKNN